MEWQFVASPDEPLDERPFQYMNGNAARPELETSFGFATLGQLGAGGRSTRSPAAGRRRVTTTPSFSSGGELLDHLERHLGLGLAVKAEEQRGRQS